MADYHALQLTAAGNQTTATWITQPQPTPQAGWTLIQVAYSDINYKDALTTDPRSGVIHHYPQTPGIDAAGTVLACPSGKFTPGTAVLLTGFDLGVKQAGGYAECLLVPDDWPQLLPTGITVREAMILGTAGFTAALSVQALLQNPLFKDKTQPILISGATGGVGGFALAILKQLGYQQLIACTRHPESAHDYLMALGATTVISLTTLTEQPLKPLMKQQFTGYIDALGGTILNAILPQIRYGGTVAISGNAAGIKLTTTTLPFILRGIQLIGIDSVYYPAAQRAQIWQHLATDWRPTHLEQFVNTTITRQQLATTLTDYLHQVKTGRILVALQA